MLSWQETFLNRDFKNTNHMWQVGISKNSILEFELNFWVLMNKSDKTTASVYWATIMCQGWLQSSTCANLHTNFTRLVPSLFSYYKRRNWSLQIFCYLSRVTQLVSSEVGIWICQYLLFLWEKWGSVTRACFKFIFKIICLYI